MGTEEVQHCQNTVEKTAFSEYRTYTHVHPRRHTFSVAPVKPRNTLIITLALLQICEQCIILLQLFQPFSCQA